MTPQETISDINTVIRLAIEAGLSDQQKYPAIRKVGKNDYDIYIENSPDLSFSLKDRPYSEIYNDLEKGRAFNLRMIDGALIQLLYKFRDNKISSHRLTMFPSPNLEIYENAVQHYEEDEIYTDMISVNAVRFPLRFDFSDDSSLHVEVDHPKSHLTFGQHAHCRIPVNSPLTPTKFMDFVLRSFYQPARARVKFNDKAFQSHFPETITFNERKVGFFTC